MLNHVLFADGPTPAPAPAGRHPRTDRVRRRNGTWRSAFLSGAHELATASSARRPARLLPDIMGALTVEQVFGSIGITSRPEGMERAPGAVVGGDRCGNHHVQLRRHAQPAVTDAPAVGAPRSPSPTRPHRPGGTLDLAAALADGTVLVGDAPRLRRLVRCWPRWTRTAIVTPDVIWARSGSRSRRPWAYRVSPIHGPAILMLVSAKAG